MRKIVITRFCSAAILFFFFQGEVSAQCKYVQVTLRNDTTVYQVAADFPVKPHTSDEVADQKSFLSAFTDWAAGKSTFLPSPVTTGVKFTWFEIPSAVFQQMPEERRSAIKIYPSLYRIVTAE